MSGSMLRFISAPLQCVFVHSLRLTTPGTSSTAGEVGALVGGGAICPTDSRDSLPEGSGYRSYLPRSSFPSMLCANGQSLTPCLGLPVHIILLVSTAYLDRGFTLHCLARKRKLWPCMEWQPHCPQYNTPLSHLAWWLLWSALLPQMTEGPLEGMTQGLSNGCVPYVLCPRQGPLSRMCCVFAAVQKSRHFSHSSMGPLRRTTWPMASAGATLALVLVLWGFHRVKLLHLSVVPSVAAFVML